MKKSIFLFFAAILCATNAWAWCGNSFITVNGLWCTGSNSYVHDGGKFHEKDLGTLTTLELGGEFQVWPSSATAGTLCYKIDNGTENSISLPKTGTDGNNSKHSGSGAVDLSGLAGGSHSIAVWFKHGSDIDNNGGSNFVATFTIAAATPDPEPEPEPIADVTVHFINSVEWAAVACHHWVEGGSGTSWPGDVLSTTDEIAGYDVYTATFTGAHISCIFNNNNNGQQTGNLTVENGKYYEANTNTWYADKAAAEAALATPIPDETVYLINTGNWSKAMIHTWNGVGGTAWPGVEMTLTGETIEGYAVYSYTAKQGGQANLLFQESENVNKTSDLTWEAGKYYAPLKNEWYDTKEAAAEALAAPVEYEYVYLINTNDWAAAHIYTWTPEVAGWPGAAMTLEAEQIAGKDVYSYKVVKGTTFGGLLFNCGSDECKTGDLAWEAGKYYAPSKVKWYDDAAAAEAALNTPAVITYALMGVAGDWTTGITMTYDEENNQYILTNQSISKATDAVKVAKLSDGSPVEWYNAIDTYTACTYTHVDDGFGGQNIVLEDGTYDFYFKLSNNEIYISKQVPATATITLVDAEDMGATLTLSADEYAVGDEITASAAIYDDGFAFAYWKEGDVIVSYNPDYTFTVEGDRTLKAYFGNNMPVEMADLVVDGDAMTITGSNTTDGVTASLKLDEYDSDMELWSIDAANSTIGLDPLGSGTPITLDILYGEVWLDMDAFSMAMAKVVATFNDELFVFNLDMTAATETLEVGVATELSLEFGALVMRGTWYDENDVEYPFEAQVGGFDYTKAEQECMTTVSLGNFDDDTNWLGMAQGLMTVTVADGTVELTGTVTTNYPVNTLNVVAQGMIEILDLNLDATVEEMDLGVDGKYLHLTAVDDEVSGMDFDLYLNDYTGADGEYELNEMSTVAGGAAAATGSLTKSGNTYTGTLYAAAGTLYVFDLTLTEFVPTYDNISLTGLTGQAEARYMGWGDEYYLALSLEGTWSDGVETYPVLLEITDGYDAAATSGTVAVSLTIGGWEETDPWLGNAEGELSYTLSGKNITLKGKMENPYGWPAAVYWDVTLTGTILPNYTRDVTAGNFGTLCLPFGGKVKGAELFECVGQETGKVYLASVTTLVAGVPYIFLANANQIAVYCDATVADEAGTANGLVGTFVETTVPDGDYILYNNAFCTNESAGTLNKIKENRAYLNMDAVDGGAPQQMPGRRYIGMSVQGENEATGFENITAPAGKTVKVIVNGQLIIIRDGEMYNAQGQRL